MNPPLHKDTTTKNESLRQCLAFLHDEKAKADTHLRHNDLHDLIQGVETALTNPYATVPDPWRKHTVDMEHLLLLLRMDSTVTYDADHDCLVITSSDELSEITISRNARNFAHSEEGLTPDESIFYETLAYDAWESSSSAGGNDVQFIKHAPWSTLVSLLAKRFLDWVHYDAITTIDPTNEVVPPPAEPDHETVALLYQHGGLGHDSYQSGTRNLEDSNVHLQES